MLCLDESSPVIMALSLAGAVLLIVGGSLWGSGDTAGNARQTAAGIGLFCGSLALLMLAGLGCWCNKCFCTPERKSRLAQRFYNVGNGSSSKQGGGNKRPSTDDTEDSAGADCGSLGSSFRSLRSSRRSVRASLRRDRVQPATDPTEGPPTSPPIPEQPEEPAAAASSSSKRRDQQSNSTAAAPDPSADAAGPSQLMQLPQTSIDDVSEGGSSTHAYSKAEEAAQRPDDDNADDEHRSSTTIVRC